MFRSICKIFLFKSFQKRSEREHAGQALNKNLLEEVVEMKEKCTTMERNVLKVEAMLHRGKKKYFFYKGGVQLFKRVFFMEMKKVHLESGW